MGHHGISPQKSLLQKLSAKSIPTALSLAAFVSQSLWGISGTTQSRSDGFASWLG
jgi:hypothetical protein